MPCPLSTELRPKRPHVWCRKPPARRSLPDSVLLVLLVLSICLDLTRPGAPHFGGDSPAVSTAAAGCALRDPIALLHHRTGSGDFLSGPEKSSVASCYCCDCHLLSVPMIVQSLIIGAIGGFSLDPHPRGLLFADVMAWSPKTTDTSAK